ncbi:MULTISPECIES: fimbria/pilus outer membrane usher protein [unclassified Serratia (in: enterobacteria)]|uniref:fimbria/pilus outer membrane usher protein n=1 Tax=unclassified Serratia (in: enterobacteria) TaxID=2647522 RepID=UPI001E4CCCEF|nr:MULTISPECIES: fimbria/pilus outer membrane usher protein [unclassified Serratia (in: enterobacteria)]
MQYKLHHTSSRHPARSALSLALLSALAIPPLALADTDAKPMDDVEFDVQAMKSSGIDPKVAELFRNAPRFMPGETTVTLSVNGSSRGKVQARFDSEGHLCADQAFQKQAGILVPPGFTESAPCFDLKSAWPQTELNLNPGEERVALVLPPQAVAAPGSESGNWNHGGFAGMLNYQAQYMDSAGSTAGINFMQLGTEAGFNFSDWIIRSRQTFTRFNSKNSVQHQGAYAQRSFTDIKKVLQAGQVSLSNSLFGTGQVLGFQMFPEAALVGNRGGAGLVEGIADSQSVVEVRQSGALIYSTTVPAGPFRLQGFSLLNTRTDLDVAITGSSGEKRQFTVPASAFLLNGTAVAPGLSFGAGKLDQQGSSESPLLATAATGWQLTPHTALNAGVLGSSPYRAGALRLDTQPFDETQLSLQTTLAQDEKHSKNGASIVASFNRSITERVSVNANASQQTSGYRELSDALQAESQDNSARNRNQFGGGLSWAQESIGSLSLSWVRTNTFDSDHTDYVRSGWSKQIASVFVGASLEHSTGSRTTEAENRAYLTVNIPFGSRSISSYVNSASNGSRAGIRYSDRSSQDRGWSLMSERDFSNQSTSTGATLDMVTPISQFSGGLTHRSDNITTWSARATGGIVAHHGGVTLSPYNVGDTFGIAKIGDEAGVRIETPAGPTWTDRRGYAVIPTLNGFKRSAVQVDTRSLGKNVDIDNALQETEAARGSVSYFNFDVVRTRRVLVEAQDTQGRPLPYGASVFDSAGNFVTVVGEKGSLFIPDAANDMTLEVQNSGKTICRLKLTLPEKSQQNELYETATVKCR